MAASAATASSSAPAEASLFRKRERINRGSFGEVYLAEHVHTGEQHVLKTVRLARQSDWQRAASHLELKLARELAHPFIVPHIASWLDRGHTVCLVWQFCARGDMASMLQRHKVRCPHPSAAERLAR